MNMEQNKLSNRIVVDYNGLDDIILLAIFHTETGEEIPLHDVGFTNVEKYDGIKDINLLKSLNEKNKEGFVVRFESGLRLKIKFDDYLAIHRIITHFTPKHIWEALKSDSLMDLINILPDELYNQFNLQINEFRLKFDKIKEEAISEFNEFLEQKNLTTRKEQAMFILTKRYSSILFLMLDGKNYDELIWDLVKT